MDAHLSDPVGKGVGNRLAQDVVRPIHIRVQTAPSARLEEAALETLPSVDLLLGHWLQIQEAALGGVALFAYDDVDAYQLCLVLEHRDEPRVRHKDEVLIRALAQRNGLFPAVVLADHQRPDAVRHEVVHDTATGDM